MDVSEPTIKQNDHWEEHYYTVTHEHVLHEVVMRCETTYRWDWLLDIDGHRFGYCRGVNDGLKRARALIRNGSVARAKAAFS